MISRERKQTFRSGINSGHLKFSNLILRTLWISVVVLTEVSGFNVDTRTAVVHQGPNGSMFGFSVAMHRDRDFSW